MEYYIEVLTNLAPKKCSTRCNKDLYRHIHDWPLPQDSLYLEEILMTGWLPMKNSYSSNIQVFFIFLLILLASWNSYFLHSSLFCTLLYVAKSSKVILVLFSQKSPKSDPKVQLACSLSSYRIFSVFSYTK